MLISFLDTSDSTAMKEPLNETVTIGIVVAGPLEKLRACVASIETNVHKPHRLSFVANQKLSSETEAFIQSLKGAQILYGDAINDLSTLNSPVLHSSDSEFVVLLTSDALPGDRWFESLSSVMQSDPRIGAVGSICVDPGNKSILHAGIELADDAHPLYTAREQFLEHLQIGLLPPHPLAVQANGMMLRKSVLEESGYFAEGYQSEYADVDLCLRIWAAGYKVALSPSSILFHQETNRIEKILHRRANLNALSHAIDSSPGIKAVIETRRAQSPPVADGATSLVSVLYPAYNDERFLEDNIESIINQTYRHWELLVVNDASTDSTPDILQRYADAYPDKIKVIHKDTHDRFEAWAMLYRASRGKYLAIIGADDVFLPNKLAQQVELLEANPSCPLVHSDVYHFDEDGHLIALSRVEDPSAERQIVRLLEYNILHTPAVLLRKTAVEDSGGWLNREFLYAQDYDLWLRLLKGRALRCIHEPLLKYRMHQWQLTQVAGPEKMSNHLRLVLVDKLKRWQPEDLFPGWDLDTEKGMTAFYKEAHMMFFLGNFRDPKLQLPLLNFLEPLIDKEISSQSVRSLRTEFLSRVSYDFLRNRQYKLSASYLRKAATGDPLFGLALFRVLLQRVRRRLSEFKEEKTLAISIEDVPKDAKARAN